MVKVQQQFISSLQKTFGKASVLIDPAQCLPYGSDNGRHHATPDAVVFANNAEQIQLAVQLCNQFHIPIIARGLGSGTPGGAVPIHGGLVLCCERMQRIIKIDPDNRLMVVEPGVINQDVQDLAAQHGFFWAPDPGSAMYCTIGGNLAYNAAGPRAIKYGTPRENTLGLTAITGSGEIIRTGTYTTKGVVGYDLTRLLIGSEGTLAIITEAILKLTPLPETKRTMRAVYSDIHSATQAVSKIMAQAVVPCALEFLDCQAIKLIINAGVALPNTAQALLIIEIDGVESAMNSAVAKLQHAATNSGLLEFSIANNTTEVEKLWQARKALSPALRTISTYKINEDVVVPVSRLPELIAGLEQLAQRYEIPIVNFGHAGNGNIHVNLLPNAEDIKQQQRAELCLSEVFDLVLKLDGSLSGEHGVGIEKKAFIDREIDAVSLELMRKIKAVFDPNNILNPGKIFL